MLVRVPDKSSWVESSQDKSAPDKSAPKKSYRGQKLTNCTCKERNTGDDPTVSVSVSLHVAFSSLGDSVNLKFCVYAIKKNSAILLRGFGQQSFVYNNDYHHRHHQSLNREGRWGTTDDFATSFLHFFPRSSLPSGTRRTPGLSIP